MSPERIIHIAEVHDIECHDSRRPFRLDTVAQRFVQALTEQRPLGKTRQRIEIRQILSRCLLLAVLQRE